MASFLDMQKGALQPQNQRGLSPNERHLKIWSLYFSRYEFRLLFKYNPRRERLTSSVRLHAEYMQKADEVKQKDILKKCLVAGLDPGKRSTFTLCFLFVLQLLMQECPKLCSALALNMSYGHHRSLAGSIPHYNFCLKVIEHFTGEHANNNNRC
jgi:hypothetical protein